MNDDDQAPPSADGTAMLYDWFKHLTSLSLLTLGGILSLSQVPKAAAEIDMFLVAGVAIVVALAGVMSFTGAAEVVRARVDNSPLSSSVGFVQKAVPILLMMSVGAFLYIFVKAIN